MLQPHHPRCGKPVAPQKHRGSRGAQVARDAAVGQAGAGQQANPRAEHDLLGRGRSSDPSLQLMVLLFGHRQTVSGIPHAREIPRYGLIVKSYLLQHTSAGLDILARGHSLAGAVWLGNSELSILEPTFRRSQTGSLGFVLQTECKPGLVLAGRGLRRIGGAGALVLRDKGKWEPPGVPALVSVTD